MNWRSTMSAGSWRIKVDIILTQVLNKLRNFPHKMGRNQGFHVTIVVNHQLEFRGSNSRNYRDNRKTVAS